MAVTTTELVAEIRQTSDLQASQFCTDTELLRMVNECLAELYDILVISREGYFQTSTSLTLTNNAASLPTDFYKEIGITAGTAPNITNIPVLESFNDRLLCNGPRYWIAGRTLTVYPTTVSVTPVTLDYVPNCPVLATATDIPVDMERFREYLAVAASIKVKAKRKQDATDLVARLERLTARVVRAATGRKAGPRVVAMPLREQYRNDWFHGRYNRYGF